MIWENATEEQKQRIGIEQKRRDKRKLKGFVILVILVSSVLLFAWYVDVQTAYNRAQNARFNSFYYLNTQKLAELKIETQNKLTLGILIVPITTIVIILGYNVYLREEHNSLLSHQISVCIKNCVGREKEILRRSSKYKVFFISEDETLLECLCTEEDYDIARVGQQFLLVKNVPIFGLYMILEV